MLGSKGQMGLRMGKKQQLTPEQVTEIFASLDSSGVLDPSDAARALSGKSKRRPKRAARVVDPLSEEDPSGSDVSGRITKFSVAFLIIVLGVVVGLQFGYGILRRVNTTRLSEEVTFRSVYNALSGGVEWGSGYTEFPSDFTINRASERAGEIEVTVVDTSASGELELLSSSQIQATALATNAFLNEKINRVVYNVSVVTGKDGSFQNSSFFGFAEPEGIVTPKFTFTWTKHQASGPNGIDWECRITAADAEVASRIEEQINSMPLGIGDVEVDPDAYLSQEELQGTTRKTLTAPSSAAPSHRKRSEPPRPAPKGLVLQSGTVPEGFMPRAAGRCDPEAARSSRRAPRTQAAWSSRSWRRAQSRRQSARLPQRYGRP